MEDEFFIFDRVDIVFDQYFDLSIKSMTRGNRGAEQAGYCVLDNTPLPTNWDEFLKNIENKKELNQFLAMRLVESVKIRPEKVFIATCNESVLMSSGCALNVDSLQPCNQEEADTRMFLHVIHASAHGSLRVTIRSNDTDIIVLGLALFPQLGLEELHVTFGTDKKYQIIPIHDMFRSLGLEKCLALLMFHSLTGCDSTTALFGIPKQTAFQKWIETAERDCLILTAMLNLTSPDLGSVILESNADVVIVERFVSSMFSQSSKTLDEARLELFQHKGTSLTRLPMTSHTFSNKLKRSMYQSSIWVQSIVKTIRLPEPEHWGFKKTDNSTLVFDWGTQLDIVSAKKWDTFRNCGCRKNCTTNGRCGCHKQTASSSSTANQVEVLGCTTLCKCPCNATTEI